MLWNLTEHGAGSGGGQPAAYSPRQASCSNGAGSGGGQRHIRHARRRAAGWSVNARAFLPLISIYLSLSVLMQHGAGSGGGQRHIRHARRRPAGRERVAAAGAAAVAAGGGGGVRLLRGKQGKGEWWKEGDKGKASTFAAAGAAAATAGRGVGGVPVLEVGKEVLPCQVYAELGSFIPHAGGDGEYLQVAFGELASFVFMWMFFFVSTGGALSILVVTFARYAVALVRGVLVGGGARGGWVVLVGVVFEAPQKRPRYAIALVRGVPVGGGARGGWCSWGVVLVGGVLVGGGARGGRRAKLPGAAAGGEEEMEVMVMVVGGGCVLLLTLVNCCGVEAGTWLQNLLSLSKALLIAIILSLPHLCAISTSSYQLSLSSGVEAGTWLQNLLSLSKALLIAIILSLPHLCAISTSSYQLSLSSGVEAGTWLQNLLSLSKALLIAIILSLPHLCAISTSSYQLSLSSGVEAGTWLQNLLSLSKALLIAIILSLPHLCAISTSSYQLSLSSGVEAGTWLQNLLSLSKALLIAIILAAAPAFMLLQGPATATANLLQPLPPLDSLDLSRLGAGLVAAIWAFDGWLGAGLVAAIWAFDGWNCLGFLSEELKNPKRDLPRSLSIGMLIAVVICVSGGVLSANVAYLCILPAQAIGISQVVAVDSVALVFGPAAGRLVALLVAFNVLGSANGTLLCNARYFYAMAREGRLPRFFGAVTKSGAPYAALCLIGGWTMVLLFFAANQLEKLLDYFGIATWIFYGAVAAALFKLRWAFPNGPRPYEARFYPLPPVIALVAAV
ncbi:unnamed protein product, partial [Closterium sp. NIES-64]